MSQRYCKHGKHDRSQAIEVDVTRGHTKETKMTLKQAEFIIKVVVSGKVPVSWNRWVGPLYTRAANLIVSNWDLTNH